MISCASLRKLEKGGRYIDYVQVEGSEGMYKLRVGEQERVF